MFQKRLDCFGTINRNFIVGRQPRFRKALLLKEKNISQYTKIKKWITCNHFNNLTFV